MPKLIVIIWANQATSCSVVERARLSRSSSDTIARMCKWCGAAWQESHLWWIGRASALDFRTVANANHGLCRADQQCNVEFCIIRDAAAVSDSGYKAEADTATSTVISRGLPVERCRSYGGTRSSARSGRSSELGQTLPGKGEWSACHYPR